MQVDPFQNTNQMFLQANQDEQNQNHVFPQYNYPQQGGAVPPPTTTSQQQYLAYTNPSDTKGAVNVVQTAPATAYMQQTPPMFYNNYPQGQPGLQPPPQGGEYFQQGIPGSMQYPNQQAASAPQQNSGNHGGRGNRGGRGGGRSYPNNPGFNAYGNTPGLHSFNAVPEKTPTVRLLHPQTDQVVHIKLNRVAFTAAEISRDIYSADSAPSTTPPIKICPLCISPQTCPRGSACQYVHVTDIQYAWEPVDSSTVTVGGKKMYLPGFYFRCYDPSQTHYLKVQSENIQVTKGSTDYIVSYNQHGENFKSKYVLCQQFMANDGQCEKGEMCTNLHCTEKNLNRLGTTDNSTSTHLNDPVLMQNVPRLPQGFRVRAFDQNSNATYRDYDGSQVLMTVGARLLLRSTSDEHNQYNARRRMQQCAHFRLKSMCRLGESCRFLHVLPSAEEVGDRNGTVPTAGMVPGPDMCPVDDRRPTTHNPYA